MNDYYAILGVSPDATPREIKTAFWQLAQIHHPDLGGDEEGFKELNEAYRVLSDPVRKREYDIQRNALRGVSSHLHHTAFTHKRYLVKHSRLWPLGFALIFSRLRITSTSATQDDMFFVTIAGLAQDFKACESFIKIFIEREEESE